mgnify:CR=1 FL=1
MTLSGSLGLLESLRDYLLHALEEKKGGEENEVKLFAAEEKSERSSLEEDVDALKRAAERDERIRKLVGDLADLVRNAGA